jgi:hypothetical protein
MRSFIRFIEHATRVFTLRRARSLILLSTVLAAGFAPARAVTPRLTARGRIGERYLDARISVAPRALLLALARVDRVVPSFSRQTGLACSVCHYQFPQLTPFGRLFKLNGYTLSGLTGISAGDTSRPSLKVSPIPPIAAMFVASLTQTGVAAPAAQNASAQMPEQASLFVAGSIAPRMGAFTQFTYAAQDGSFGVDNIDLRYANHTAMAGHDLLFGLTLHNNPTVQDVWNTLPAWSYPFMSSSVATEPIASTLIEGGLEQEVLGLGGYALWDNLIYAELTGYRSAQQGAHAPLDSGASRVISGVVPYGRVALQHTVDHTYLMIGGFGFANARLYPTGVTGPTDHYTTLGLDAQVERRLTEAGAMLVGRASWTHESQTLDATFAEGEAERASATLRALRVNASFLPNTFVGATVGYFSTTGSSDSLRFAPAELTGSRTGRPDTRGLTGEVDANVWQNVRLGLQYTAYSRFNGASDAYDVVGGRRASDNNVLYLYSWIAF